MKLSASTVSLISLMALLSGGVSEIFALGPDESIAHSRMRKMNLQRGAQGPSDQGHVGRIDLLNGNLVAELPLGVRYPLGEGRSYGLQLTYNSSVWDWRDYESDGQRRVAAQPVANTLVGTGWTLGLAGATYGRLLAPGNPSNESDRWLFVDASGLQRLFYPTLIPGEPSDPTTSYTRDGSRVELKSGQDGQVRLRFPDGQRLQYEEKDGALRLVGWRDVKGGRIDVVYSDDGRVWTLVDSEGRTHTLRYRDDPTGTYPALLDQIELSAFAGATATYQFEYNTLEILRPKADTDPMTGPSVVVPILREIHLPEGMKYLASYGGNALNGGRLTSLTIPEGGTLEWEYRTWSFPWLDCTPLSYPELSDVVGVASRRMVNTDGSTATWTYSSQLQPERGLLQTCEQPKQLTTRVSTPLGHESVHYFSVFVSGDPSVELPDDSGPGSSGSPLEPEPWSAAEYGVPGSKFRQAEFGLLTSEVFDRGDLVREHWKSFEETTFGDCDGVCVDRATRLASQRTVFHDDSFHYVETRFRDFDGLAYRERESRSSFGPSRLVRTEFLHDRGKWILDLPLRTESHQEGEARVESRCFDERGRELRVRTLAGLEEGAHDLVREIEVDSRGNPVSIALLGGDTQELPVGELCSLELPAPQYSTVQEWRSGALAVVASIVPGGERILTVQDDEIDPSTGLASIKRDSAGLESRFEYDRQGRVVRQLVPEGTERQTVYRSSGGRLDGEEAVETSGSPPVLLSRRVVERDGFGRKLSVDSTGPDGSLVGRSFSYDAAGNLSLSTDVNGRTIQRLDFDPFGRPRVVRPIGSQVGEEEIHYRGIRFVGSSYRSGDYFELAWPMALVQSEKTRESTFLPDGSLESSTDSAGRASKRHYDIDGNLVAVELIEADGEVVQLLRRRFDGRGFLVEEMDSEGGIVEYTGYDSRGLRHRIDGPHGTRWVEHDAAGRQISVADGSGRLLVEYAYARTNGPSDMRSGKLWQSVRYHHDVPGAEGVLAVRDTLRYGGPGGRLSGRSTEIEDAGGVRQRFEQSATFDELGRIASYSYPACETSWRLHCGGEDRRWVDYHYKQENPKLLDAVKSRRAGASEVVPFVTGLDYFPDGAVRAVDYGPSSLISQTFSRDAMWSGSYSKVSTCSSSACDHVGPVEFDDGGRRVRVVSGPIWPSDQMLLPLGLPDGPDQEPTLSNLQEALSQAETGTGCPERIYDASGRLTRVVRCPEESGAPVLAFVYAGDGSLLWTVGSENGLDYDGRTSTWQLRDLWGRTVREYRKYSASGTLVEDRIYRGGSLVGLVSSPFGNSTETHRFFVHQGLSGAPRSMHREDAGVVVDWTQW